MSVLKQNAVLIAALGTIALLTAGALAFLLLNRHEPQLPVEPQPAAEQAAPEAPAPAKARLGFAITAEGWTAESTPVFVRVTGTSTSGAPVNFYHAVEQANEATRFIELEAGSYTFSYGGPVNADGTMYRADDTVLDIAGDRSIDVFFERIDPAAAGAEQIDALEAFARTAVENGDEALKSQGQTMLDRMSLALAAAREAHERALAAAQEETAAAAVEQSTETYVPPVAYQPYTPTAPTVAETTQPEQSTLVEPTPDPQPSPDTTIGGQTGA